MILLPGRPEDDRRTHLLTDLFEAKAIAWWELTEAERRAVHLLVLEREIARALMAAA
jgi:hypothetical protein